MKRCRWIIVLALLGLVAASCGRSDDDGGGEAQATTPTTAEGSGTAAEDCGEEPLEATEIGVTADTITIEVMADVGSALAPGLFQGNIDAMEAFAERVNENGGIACRDLVVKTWDSKLSPDESKNGQLDACRTALAMVGSNALFNPDMKPTLGCVDKAGVATGLPDIAALANDVNQQCNPTTFVIQAVAETCPVVPGSPRPIKAVVGPNKYWLANNPDGLHGIQMVPGDLPTTVQSATVGIKASEESGIVFDATPKVSGRDEQSSYTPRIQILKGAGSNFVSNGSNDRAMVNIRKEAKAQGLDTIEVWACGLNCYTKAMLESGGTDVEGTWAWLQFLPFEEADTNPEAKAYVDSLGDKVDSFGAQGWQAGVAFQDAVDAVVAKDGPNGITRAALLDALAEMKDFDAHGWMGKKDLKGVSNCFVMMQIEGGEWVRRHPEEKGTFDCDPENVLTVTIDPAAEATKIK